MTGAAMSLIKKIDVDKHFAARRAMRLGRMQPLSQLGTAGTKSAAKRNESSSLCRNSHLGTFFTERILRLDSDHVRFWSEPVAQTAGKPATVKINTIFLRDGCILPSQFALRQEPFSKGWAEAMGTVATEWTREFVALAGTLCGWRIRTRRKHSAERQKPRSIGHWLGLFRR